MHLLRSLLGLATTVFAATPLPPSTAIAVTVPAPRPSTTLVVTVSAPRPIASNAPQFVDNATFVAAVLNSTNTWRQNYNAAALAWNETLAGYAASYLWSMGGAWSPASGAECSFAHSNGPYGENIALGCDDVTGCVDLWGNEVSEYNYGDPGFSEATGHFTQLVWQATTTVGCGSRLCGEREWFLVCEYWPGGNVMGEYGTEVSPPVSGSGIGIKVALS